MKVYVDADACPVKDIIIEEAGKKSVPVVLVTSISHFSLKEYPDWVETIYVDTGADAADYRIMKLAKKKRILWSLRIMDLLLSHLQRAVMYFITKDLPIPMVILTSFCNPAT